MRSELRLSVALLLAACLALPAAVVQAATLAGFTPGTPWTGAIGVHRSVADMMSNVGPQAEQARMPGEPEPEVEWPDRTGLPSATDARDLSQWPPAVDGTPAPGPRAESITTGPQTPALVFTGATLQGTNPTFSFPPDCMGAVGPTQFVVFVNGRLVTFNKITGAADGALNVDPGIFFNPVDNGWSTSDPRIRYDRLSGRWFLAIINVSTPNRILIAVSDAASNGVISGATVFTFFFIPIESLPPAISNTCLADYPTLGVDANALYLGTNNFCGSPSQTFNSCDGFVVRKSSILGAGPIVATALRGLVATPTSEGPFVPQGVDNYDPAATEGYFIGVSQILFSRLDLRRVSDPGGTPGVSANVLLTVPTTSFPLLVQHLGNTGGNAGRLAAIDDRLYAAHLRNGRLWTAHNIGVTNTGTAAGTRTRNGSRWYELTGIASPGTPALVQSGTVFEPSATNSTDQPNYWMPTVMVSGQGHVVLGGSRAGTNAGADAFYTGRLSGDGAGAMNTPAQYTFTSDQYNPAGDPGGTGGRRWGDYSFTSLDPIDDQTLWTIQQFCDASNSYGVSIVKLLAPPPAAPTTADSVDVGLASVASMVVGTPVSGSGFFDPGANLGGGVPAYSHLIASVNNTGVTGTPPTVNGVTYINPTHVQLDLNTSGATANLAGEKYTVVITNPDGQVAVGSQILKVRSSLVGVEDEPATEFALERVSPNPAPGAIGVDFAVARESNIRLSVVDVAGREIAVLASGLTPAGRHHVAWSGQTQAGRARAGMYFVRYDAGGRVMVRRVALLR
jgi:hypothetical protein